MDGVLQQGPGSVAVREGEGGWRGTTGGSGGLLLRSFGEQSGLGPSPSDVKISAEVASAMARALLDVETDDRAGHGLFLGRGEEHRTRIDGGSYMHGNTADAWTTPKMKGASTPGLEGTGSGRDFGVATPLLLPSGASGMDSPDELGLDAMGGILSAGSELGQAMIWRVPSDTEHLTKGYLAPHRNPQGTHGGDMAALRNLADLRRVRVSRLPAMGYRSAVIDGHEAWVRHELAEQAMARVVD